MALQAHFVTGRSAPASTPTVVRAPRPPSGVASELGDPLAIAVAALQGGATPPTGLPPERDLAGIWQGVLDGRLVCVRHGDGPSGSWVLFRAGHVPPHRAVLSRIETAVLVRVLCGDQQKSVAVDLEIACSTASKWHTLALAKLGLSQGTVPVPLVIAAQAWSSGQNPVLRARRAELEVDGSSYVLVDVPKPKGHGEGLLTPAEREVAQLLISGLLRREIADVRCTSTQTVASQLRGIFAKLQVGGRCALIRRAVQTGWFE